MIYRRVGYMMAILRGLEDGGESASAESTRFMSVRRGNVIRKFRAAPPADLARRVPDADNDPLS